MNIGCVVERQRAYFDTGATLSIDARIETLCRLRAEIKRSEQRILDALAFDLGKSSQEAYMCEIGLVLSELRHQIAHIRSWARPKRCKTDIGNFPAQSFTVAEPYGVVLVMAPWNYPFMLCMEPLIGAIAAGNCCVVKPSAYAPATSRVVAEVIEAAFDPSHATTIEGGRTANEALLDQKFDYIFFTGSPAVGKTVMSKAAEHLTPVSLELGGKSPCIVAADANLALAARRIAFGKFLNCGQTCIAPDYILVEQAVHDEFVALLGACTEKMYGADALRNPHYGRIVNRKHFDRILSLIDPAKTVYGGTHCVEKLRIEPTIMDYVDGEDAIMGEEIFGPVLPIVVVDDMIEAEAFVKARPKPLALYLFTEDRTLQERFVRNVSFGGGCINDTVMHLATSNMGFGGVGASGMGSYHGEESFNTFSHRKSILRKSSVVDIPLRYQPYSRLKERIVRRVLR